MRDRRTTPLSASSCPMNRDRIFPGSSFSTEKSFWMIQSGTWAAFIEAALSVALSITNRPFFATAFSIIVTSSLNTVSVRCGSGLLGW